MTPSTAAPKIINSPSYQIWRDFSGNDVLPAKLVDGPDGAYIRKVDFPRAAKAEAKEMLACFGGGIGAIGLGALALLGVNAPAGRLVSGPKDYIANAVTGVGLGLGWGLGLTALGVQKSVVATMLGLAARFRK